MKAVVCKEYGPAEKLVVEDVPALIPGTGQVVVAVHACGVNFPDNLIIENKYQVSVKTPFSPGREAAGVITATGAGVTGFRIGDRVIAAPGVGGFAEEMLAREQDLFPLPEGVSYIDAAAFMITYATSYYALKERARLQPGETLLVLGAAGGTGLSAVELGKLMGARVIAAASSDDKLLLCREYGADETINYAAEDLRARINLLTHGRGADVVYDPVGGEYSEPALRGIAWGGRFLVIGFTAGEIPKMPLNLPLLKGCSVVGVYRAGALLKDRERILALTDELLGLFGLGKIKPHVSATFPLEQAVSALKMVAQRKAKGKIVLLTARGAASQRNPAEGNCHDGHTPASHSHTHKTCS